MKGASREPVQRHCSCRLVFILKQGLDSANRIRPQQHVSAYGANVSRNVVNHRYLTTVPYSVHGVSHFVLPRASINAAFHGDRHAPPSKWGVVF